tara:strand:- start:129 stop:233 length:105 start_codon:yes stop_codon:yes gene_type:complete
MTVDNMISAWIVLLIALGAVEQYLMAREEVHHGD